MTHEFKYLKEGLATDLTDYLMSDYQLDMQTAIDTLYESDTYNKVCDPNTGLYFQGSRYVYTFLQNELQTGTLS